MKFPVQKKQPNKLAVLTQLVGHLQEEVASLRRVMSEEIDAKIAKNLGDKIELIEGGIRESILQKEVLIDKGLLTRADMNAKYAEIREKARG